MKRLGNWNFSKQILIPNWRTHSGEDVIEKGGVYDFVVNIEDAVLNNIKMVSTQKDNDVIYTLEGVKLNKKASELPKGIYIINGKKVVIK